MGGNHVAVEGKGVLAYWDTGRASSSWSPQTRYASHPTGLAICLGLEQRQLRVIARCRRRFATNACCS